MSKTRKTFISVLFLVIATIAVAAGYDRISKDMLKLGSGTSSDKTIEFDVGSATNPFFKYDQSEGKLKFSDDGINSKTFGTGEGGANYVGNASGSDGVAGWTASNTSLTVSTSSNPSNLDTAFQFDVATSVSGGSEEEVYYDITIGDNDKNRMLQVFFDYLVDGNLEDETLEVQVIADPLGSPETLKVESEWIMARDSRHTSTFVSTDASTYRIKIFRDSVIVLSSSSTFKYNRFTVNSEGINSSTIVSEWTDFTPTGLFTTNTTYTGRYRRIGEDIEIEYELEFTGTPAPAGSITVEMPNGITIADSVLSVFDLGEVIFQDTGSVNYQGVSTRQDSDTIVLRYHNSSGSTLYQATASETAPIAAIVSGDFITIRVYLTASQWEESGTTTFMSDSVVYNNSQIRHYAAAGSVTGGTDIQYDTESSLLSKQGQWSYSSGQFTIGTDGRYRITSSNRLSVGLSGNTILNLEKDGAAVAGLDVGVSGGIYLGGTATLDLYAGDLISISPTVSITLQGGDAYSFIEIVRVSDYSAGQPVGVSIATSDYFGLVKYEEGLFTPGVSDGSNSGGSTTNGPWTYFKINNRVVVSGSLVIDPIAAGDVLVYLDLPVASDLANAYDLAGSFSPFNAAGDQSGTITAEPGSDRATFKTSATGGGSITVYFTFMYQIK